jgi:hypothetical protein
MQEIIDEKWDCQFENFQQIDPCADQQDTKGRLAEGSSCRETVLLASKEIIH